MQKHFLIEAETQKGRSDDAICRRLYSVELPFVFERDRDRYFTIVEEASEALGVNITDIKVAGSAQTGYSFHEKRPFQAKSSDLDLAVVNTFFFEKMLRAAQAASLPNPNSAERPRQSAFPTRESKTLYHNFTENAAMYGMILPWQMPDCDLKDSIAEVERKLSDDHSGIFKNINFAFYMSYYFFDRKQRPNIGIYRSGRIGV